MAASGMVSVMKYFDMKPAEFKSQWAKLTDADKNDLKSGIGEFDEITHTASGTLTY